MKKNFVIVSVLLIVAIFAVACAPAATPEPTATASPVPATVTPLPSETPIPAPTETVTPSPTSLPSKTPTPSNTATPSVAFDQLEVISYSEEPSSYLLVLKLPGVKKDYRLKIDNYDFIGYYDPAYPDRLFCRGINRPTFLKDINIVFYDFDTKAELYASKVMIAIKPTLLPVVWDSAHNCENRGKNVSCDYECRVYPEDGNPCLAASCYDDCGLYFSVASCAQNVGATFNMCDDATERRLTALYGVVYNGGD